MMYLSEPKLIDTVMRQYRFKLNANAASFTTLVFLQIGALFLAFTSLQYTVSYDSGSSVTVINLSNNINVVLAMAWAFILGIIVTTAVRRNESFSFVTTRLSNQLANFLFMLTASFFAGIIAALTGPALKLIGFLRYGEMVDYTTGIITAPSDFFLRIITAISYVLLLFLIGYTISSLIQLNKLFIGVFIVLWIALSTVSESWDGTQYLSNVFNFFSEEQSLLFFLLKISGTVLGLFAVSAFITNRLEVRN